MRKLFFSALCCLAVALTAVSTVQAGIVIAGQIIDEGNTTRAQAVAGNFLMTEVTQFSNPSVAKTLDIDGDDRYGTDGVFLFSTRPAISNQDGGDGQLPFSRTPTFTSEFTNLIVADGIADNESNGNFQKQLTVAQPVLSGMTQTTTPFDLVTSVSKVQLIPPSQRPISSHSP